MSETTTHERAARAFIEDMARIHGQHGMRTNPSPEVLRAAIHRLAVARERLAKAHHDSTEGPATPIPDGVSAR